ncbi:hypothetical protein [Spiroplasma endosymbiont of Nomada ruficornis]|uniref:hypothetical protein n=1 Tax=Spiroplasma endosymbiont of Nomada ruficornis TaxID=3066325 RepID=UPI00313F0566
MKSFNLTITLWWSKRCSFIFIDKITISAFLVTIGIGSKIFSSLFSPITKKVESWISNKIYKNEELKEKNKKERDSIIKNLISDKLNTKLQTQYDILKQELDNRKDKTINELLNNKTINNSSNIEPLNVSDFDSDIKNTVNNQGPQSSISSNHNWNKVKCLLT